MIGRANELKYKKSSMDFYFHSSPFIIMIEFRLTVMAITAFAIIIALQSSTVTLTIFFSALRFLTSASSTWYDGWNSVKVVWVSIVHQLLSMVNLFNILFMIFTCHTNATLVASLSFGETLAI